MLCCCVWGARGRKNNGTVRKIDLWQLSKDQYEGKVLKFFFLAFAIKCMPFTRFFLPWIGGKKSFLLIIIHLSCHTQSPQNYYFFLRWLLAFFSFLSIYHLKMPLQFTHVDVDCEALPSKSSWISFTSLQMIFLLWNNFLRLFMSWCGLVLRGENSGRGAPT